VFPVEGAANPVIVTANAGTFKPLDPIASRTSATTLCVPDEDQLQL
jgi:hypothetical protein